MGDSIFERQSEILMTETVTVNSPSHEENLDDVGCNADLNKARFKVAVTMSDHNKRLILIVFNRLVLTESWRCNWVVFITY